MSVRGARHGRSVSGQDATYRVRSAFARAAGSYDEVSRVYDEIGRRLLTHLDPIAIEPARVLDVGCGTGTGTTLLAARYRRSRVFAVDCARPMVEVAKTKAPRLFSRQRYLCGRAERLPLGDACVDLVHANLLLPWCHDLDALLREFDRVLAPGGLLLLSSLGPDTLIEMRRVWAQGGEPDAVSGLLDMHDLGDALVHAGLVGAVMETERLTVKYPSAERLIDDLVRSGAWAARARGAAPDRPPESFARLRRRYVTMRTTAPLDVSVEIVYAHAWAPPSPPRQSFVPAPLPVRRDPSPSGPGGEMLSK